MEDLKQKIKNNIIVSLDVDKTKRLSSGMEYSQIEYDPKDVYIGTYSFSVSKHRELTINYFDPENKSDTIIFGELRIKIDVKRKGYIIQRIDHSVFDKERWLEVGFISSDYYGRTEEEMEKTRQAMNLSPRLRKILYGTLHD